MFLSKHLIHKNVDETEGPWLSLTQTCVLLLALRGTLLPTARLGSTSSVQGHLMAADRPWR